MHKHFAGPRRWKLLLSCTTPLALAVLLLVTPGCGGGGQPTVSPFVIVEGGLFIAPGLINEEEEAGRTATEEEEEHGHGEPMAIPGVRLILSRVPVEDGAPNCNEPLGTTVLTGPTSATGLFSAAVKEDGHYTVTGTLPANDFLTDFLVRARAAAGGCAALTVEVEVHDGGHKDIAAFPEDHEAWEGEGYAFHEALEQAAMAHSLAFIDLLNFAKSGGGGSGGDGHDHGHDHERKVTR